ncbi:hypothetical protein [Nonomuraea sp. NPDC050310]|uniref:hypothetical protein n=1 Tax=Nonomuraea sp. NPDC050310 TaxID=3154935 RepID=UPI0033CA0A5C
MVPLEPAAAGEETGLSTGSLLLGVPALLLILMVIPGLIFVDSRTRLPPPPSGRTPRLRRRERHIGQHREL